MPYVSPERGMNPGGGLHGYLDELPLLHRAGIRAVVSLLNNPSDNAIFTLAGFKFKC